MLLRKGFYFSTGRRAWRVCRVRFYAWLNSEPQKQVAELAVRITELEQMVQMKEQQRATAVKETESWKNAFNASKAGNKDTNSIGSGGVLGNWFG